MQVKSTFADKSTCDFAKHYRSANAAYTVIPADSSTSAVAFAQNDMLAGGQTFLQRQQGHFWCPWGDGGQLCCPNLELKMKNEELHQSSFVIHLYFTTGKGKIQGGIWE